MIITIIDEFIFPGIVTTEKNGDWNDRDNGVEYLSVFVICE